MILDTKRNRSPRLARGATSLCAVAAVIVAALTFQLSPRLVLAQTPPEPPAPVEAPPAEVPVVESSVQTEVHVENTNPDIQVRVKPFASRRPAQVSIGAAPSALPRSPRVASVFAPGGGGLYAVAGDDAGDSAPEGGPRNKGRNRNNDEGLERRLDRLERLVETLVRRDAEKKNFQFDFKDKFGAGNFNYNEDFAKGHEKMAKDAEKMAAKVMKDFEKQRGNFENRGQGPEALDIQRKVLEEHRQTLERQMHMLERQIQKLEHERERIEKDWQREEARRERDEQRREQKEKEQEDDGAKEKPEKGQ